ncbi:MAG: EamA family transporter [Candidatus Bathyarchaeota archaeon]|nr:MAG: EamA family transporter [Candidatus Bathyarchaeota archaeon]
MILHRNRLIALIEVCLVTFLWSSSYILVKIGLTLISPLNLVSLRYLIASAILIALALLKGRANMLREIRTLLKIAFLGFFGYTVAQGLQCVGLFYLPAVSVTFILNFSPLIVLTLGIIFLKEYPTMLQLVGLTSVILGAYLFFNTPLANGSPIGIIITLLSGFGWATYLVLSRRLLVKEKTNPLGLTAFSMGFGTLLMSIGAYTFEGGLHISSTSWGIILWLGIVNTALAFLLWNHALQVLEAFEISILQNTMLVQIALLSWLFLGEAFTPVKVVSMILVFTGVLLVQFKKTGKNN